MTTSRILPNEIEIVGTWILEQGQSKPSANVKRIEDLIDGFLEEVATSDDGWAKLFRDPVDGRLWELTYPESAYHGGGAPSLRNVSRDDAESRFKI